MMTRKWRAAGMLGDDQMPKYRHDNGIEVWALKITRIFPPPDVVPVAPGMLLGFSTVPCQAGVSGDYVRRHDPQIGDYFIQHVDGHVSCTAGVVFEANYALV